MIRIWLQFKQLLHHYLNAMAINEKFAGQDAFVTLYELWGRKTPSFETHFEKEVIKPLVDFGKGTNSLSDSKGKVLGAAYEVLIMAFFIGLYSKKMRPLDEYGDIKDIGQPIQFWGNIDSKKGRKAYPRLREYIFAALVARTPDINWYELDKGRWTPNETVHLLMDTMEQYINYGLSVMYEKMQEDDTIFFNQDAFLNMFKDLTHPKVESKKSGIEKFVLTFRTNCNEESNDHKHSATVTVSHLMSDYYAMNLADTQLEDDYYYVCNFDAYYNDNTVYHYKRYGNVAGLSNSEYYYDSPLSRNYGFFYPPLNLISLKQNSVKLNEKLYLNLSLYKEAISGNLVFKQGDKTLTVSINDINTDFPYVVIPYTSPLGELTLSEVYLKTNALYSFARNQGETITFNYKDSNDGRTYYKLKRDFGDIITVEKDNTTIQSELLNLDNDSLTDEIIEDIKKVEGTTTINLDATKKSKVSSDLFELIKDKDITLNIHINDNIWSINGKDIKIVKDIDVSTDLLKLDKSLSKKVGNGIVLSFKDNGKLPGKMTIRINNDEDVSAVLEGKPVYLYVFNEKEKNFEPVKEDIKLDDEGFYNLELDHNSKYVITSSKIKDKYLKGYVSNMPIIIGLTIFVLAAIGVVAFVLLKKPKEKKEEVKEEKKEEKKEVKKTKKETSKEIDEEEFVLNIKR